MAASTIAKRSLIHQQAAQAACRAPGEPEMSDSRDGRLLRPSCPAADTQIPATAPAVGRGTHMPDSRGADPVAEPHLPGNAMITTNYSCRH